MNRVVRLMLGALIAWGILAAAVLIVGHTVFVVDIRWRDNRILTERGLHLNNIINNYKKNLQIPKRNVDNKPLTPLQLPLRTSESLHKICSDNLCLDQLSVKEREYFDKCRNKTVSMRQKFGDISNVIQCRFQNGTNHLPVALASFPGSGNTWVRGLLEKVTGICTGALYCDCGLRANGFSGEGVRGSSVLVVKVHGKGGIFSNRKLPRRILHDAPVYEGTILLVRDPRNAMIAEWHREKTKRKNNATVSNHYLFVGKEYFGANEHWNEFVKDKAERWKAHINGWIITGKFNPFLIIKYEDLKNNPVTEVLKMVEFLGFKDIFTEDIIQERLAEGYNDFYRNHKDDFEHFTPEQERLIHQTVKETINLLAENGIEKSFPIKDYL